MQKSLSLSVSIYFRRWRVKVSGLRRPSEESPDFSSGLLLRNWRVEIVDRNDVMGESIWNLIIPATGDNYL